MVERELRDIIRHPALQKSFERPSDLTLDDVIEQLASFGRVSFTRPEDWTTGMACEDGYGCSLRFGGSGRPPLINSGSSLLVASLRTLAGALDVMQYEGQAMADDFQRLLADQN